MLYFGIRVAASGGVWKVVGVINKGEEALFSMKFSDSAAVRPLLEVMKKVRNIVEFGDGSPKDKLKELVALTEKLE